jgi:hypothetical protein
MSAFTNPICVGIDGTSTILQRMPFNGTEAGQYNELWLQKALFDHPTSLPMAEIDPHAGELVSICMEIQTGAGPADILYATRTGQLVLVETKLWRNAEARRVVVAQILDYAKQLSGWTFEELRQRTAAASKEGPNSLIVRMRQRYPDLDEAAFVDGINRSLKTGDFVLIIAGDGIRYGAEALVAFIERYGHLKFNFALVEVAIYKLPDQSTLLQPRVLAKTEVLTRHVFIPYPDASASVADEVDAAPVDEETLARNAAQAKWFEQFWSQYNEALLIDDIRVPKPSVTRSTNVFIPMPPGPSKAWISAYLSKSKNQGGVFLTFGSQFSDGPAWYDALYEQRLEIEKELAGLSWEKNGKGKVYITAPLIDLGNLDDLVNRQRVIKYLAEYTNKMVNVFRHRLGELSNTTLPN